MAASPVINTSLAPIQGVIALTPSDATALSPGRGLGIIATVAGNVAVQFPDGSSFAFPVNVGYSQLAFAVAKLLATGTTATATYFMLG